MAALRLVDEAFVGARNDFIASVRRANPDLIVLGHDQKASWERRAARGRHLRQDRALPAVRAPAPEDDDAAPRPGAHVHVRTGTLRVRQQADKGRKQSTLLVRRLPFVLCLLSFVLSRCSPSRAVSTAVSATTARAHRPGLEPVAAPDLVDAAAVARRDAASVWPRCTRCTRALLRDARRASRCCGARWRGAPSRTPAASRRSGGSCRRRRRGTRRL